MVVFYSNNPIKWFTVEFAYYESWCCSEEEYFVYLPVKRYFPALSIIALQTNTTGCLDGLAMGYTLIS